MFFLKGWGCGYRTLQTLCSWITKINKNISVPDIPTIQQTLVKIEDKPNAFLGSKNWIGTVEVSIKYFTTDKQKYLHI